MKDSPINRFLQIEEVDPPGQPSSLKISVRSEFFNEAGIPHGGIVGLLLDGAMGRTVMRTITPEETAATVQLSIQYHRLAEGTLTAGAKILRRGRRVIFVQGECHDDQGRLVAAAQGTWAVRPSPGPEFGGEGSA